MTSLDDSPDRWAAHDVQRERTAEPPSSAVIFAPYGFAANARVPVQLIAERLNVAGDDVRAAAWNAEVPVIADEVLATHIHALAQELLAHG